jgi:hypothetical protein
MRAAGTALTQVRNGVHGAAVVLITGPYESGPR